MSAVIANAREALLSPNDIEVMHFLFEHPTSTEKLILDGVCALQNANDLSSVLESLKSKGLILIHLDALYSLTELGEVVIGKKEANTFLASEVIRRGLPKVACARPGTYRWGDKSSRAPLQVVQQAVDSALDAWCFLKEEYDHLCEITPIQQPSALTNRLLARGLFEKNNGVITRTSLGQQLVDDPSKAVPANTHWLGLTRNERLLVECMAKRQDQFAHQSSLFDLLSVHGFPGTKKDLKLMLDGLLSKNILLYRSNKAYYLRYPVLMVMGMRKFSPEAESEILSMPNGAAILERLKAGATDALTAELRTYQRGKASKETEPFSSTQKAQLPLLESGGSQERKSSAEDKVTAPVNTTVDVPDTSSAPTVNEQEQTQVESLETSPGDDLTVMDDTEDAVSTFPTAEEFAVMDSLMPEPQVDEQEAWYQSAMQALSGFEVREPMLPAPKIKSPGVKAAFLTKLASMFDAEKGKDVRVMLDMIAKDLREFSAWQSAQKKRG